MFLKMLLRLVQFLSILYFVRAQETIPDLTFVQLENGALDCQNVLVDGNVASKGGILRSPTYFKRSSIHNEQMKCTWKIVAPASHQIEIKLVDYEKANDSACDQAKLVLSNQKETDKLSMIVSRANVSELTRHSFANGRLDSCEFNVKPLTIVRSNSSSLSIVYESTLFNSTTALLDFYLTFAFVKTNELFQLDSAYATCNNKDEVKCLVDYNLSDFKENSNNLSSNDSLSHFSCIHKDLLCNCHDDNVDNDVNYLSYHDKCDLLMGQNDGYIGLLLTHEIDKHCEFYLALNRKCRTKQIAANTTSNRKDNFLPIDEEEPLIEYESLSNQEDDEHPVKESRILVANEDIQINDMCNTILRDTNFGWISSPGFKKRETAFGNRIKNKYPDNVTCSYHLTVPEGKQIQVRFNYYYLNPSFSQVKLSDTTKRSKRQLSGKTSRYFKRVQPPLEFKNETFLKFEMLKRSVIDYDYINIYDGSNDLAPLLVHLTGSQNDFMSRNLNAKVFEARSNQLFVVFHSQKSSSLSVAHEQKYIGSPMLGFNMTYQVKGYCIEDQKSCKSSLDDNCYSESQRCNDIWNCQNGEDERGCGQCSGQFLCRDHLYCYHMDNRCDGDHQCIDRSDEMDCDSWLCNSANGTFLCANRNCIYEEWVCDGANDCEDGSDEIDCPTPFTRRVITTAVIGGTLCCLLLVMALGCACKLYTLHTVGYRTNMRISHSGHSASASASSAPLLANSYIPVGYEPYQSADSSRQTLVSTLTEPTVATSRSSGSGGFSLYNNIASLLRRPNQNATAIASSTNSENNTDTTPADSTATNDSAVTPSSPPPAFSGALPLPHHLIAPPTYNQTMGLVDEYEQRQLAFIEHVRTILTQQQEMQQQSSSSSATPAASIIPTVTSSSTTMHRVTSNSGYSRRSHSNRGGTRDFLGSSHSSRHHHRHGNHHHHHHHHHALSASLRSSSNADGNNIGNNEHSSNSNSSGRRHNQSHNRQNFDANRRGLLINSNESSTRRGSNSTTTAPTSSTQLNLQNSTFSAAILQSQRLNVPLNFTMNSTSANQATAEQTIEPTNPSIDVSSASAAEPNPSATALSTASAATTTNTFNSLINKTSNASNNLRDRLAKLIKDIVVHHGDNIQYVQLADQSSVNQVANQMTTNLSTSLSSTTSATRQDTANSKQTSQEDEELKQIVEAKQSLDHCRKEIHKEDELGVEEEDEEIEEEPILVSSLSSSANSTESGQYLNNTTTNGSNKSFHTAETAANASHSSTYGLTVTNTKSEDDSKLIQT